MSKGEEKIVTLLQRSQYRFEREKRFEDLKRGQYRFDFYVYRYGGPAIIEFQGQQHYQYIEKFYHSRGEFEKAKERDRRKISYCLAHNIPIYIIPYWEIDNINSALGLFQSKFLAKNRWKNDQDWRKQKNLTKELKI